MAWNDDAHIQDCLNRDYDPLDDLDPICGNCGRHSTFTERSDYRQDSETGYVAGVWLVCDSCGAETTYTELDRWQQQRTFELKPVLAHGQYPGGVIGKMPLFNAANVAHVEQCNKLKPIQTHVTKLPERP